MADAPESVLTPVQLFACLKADGGAVRVELGSRSITTWWPDDGTFAVMERGGNTFFGDQTVLLNTLGMVMAKDTQGRSHVITFHVQRPLRVSDLRENS